MTERRFLLSPFYELDEQFCIHYGPGKAEILLPCEMINDSELKIGLVDNNRLNPRRLLLTDKDREPIRVDVGNTETTHILHYPGKSGFILFGSKPDRELVGDIVGRLLSGTADRRDHLHCATVAAISAANWRVYWAPLQMTGNLLHIRLVPSSLQEPSLEDATRLAEVFERVC